LFHVLVRGPGALQALLDHCARGELRREPCLQLRAALAGGRQLGPDALEVVPMGRLHVGKLPFECVPRRARFCDHGVELRDPLLDRSLAGSGLRQLRGVLSRALGGVRATATRLERFPPRALLLEGCLEAGFALAKMLCRGIEAPLGVAGGREGVA
jgi:hypothetical protein